MGEVAIGCAARPSCDRLSGAPTNGTRPGDDWDVVVLGGALAGSAAALLLLREQPGLRVLILERSVAFGRRVGEATVEISGFFLGRVLGLTRHLNEAHLVKQGMRFWFHDEQTTGLADCGEIGTRYLVRLPAYQLDRSVLDGEVLRLACEAGARCWRPATVVGVHLGGRAGQVVKVQHNGAVESIRARWVVDASGVAAVLARQEGWLVPNRRHPTCSAWARWQGVRDWDGSELATRYPEWAAACPGIRGTATNHFMGDGWWAWCIPLKGGDTSVGVVFDERRVAWPSEGSLAERLKGFLMAHPVAREILADARCKEGDVHWRRHLAYSCRVQAGEGFVLIGDAAGFLDPLYSPGLDWVAFTTFSGVEIVLSDLGGEELGERLNRHNAVFAESYSRWFEAIYEGKYAYLGDFELMRTAFLLDLGLYYLGVVSQPFRRGAMALREPVFSTPPSIPFFLLMRAYNRRFAAIADARRRRGTFGSRNGKSRFLFRGYTLELTSARPLLGALLHWAWLELKEGWRSWGRATFPQPAKAAMPLPTPGAASAPASGRSVASGPLE